MVRVFLHNIFQAVNEVVLQSRNDFLKMITGEQMGKMSTSNDSSLHRPVLTGQENTEFESLSNVSNLSASSTRY